VSLFLNISAQKQKYYSFNQRNESEFQRFDLFKVKQFVNFGLSDRFDKNTMINGCDSNKCAAHRIDLGWVLLETGSGQNKRIGGLLC
jgi:hypothetical protein